MMQGGKPLANRSGFLYKISGRNGPRHAGDIQADHSLYKRAQTAEYLTRTRTTLCHMNYNRCSEVERPVLQRDRSRGSICMVRAPGPTPKSVR